MILLVCFADCKFNCHKKCMDKVPKDCLGEVSIPTGKEIYSLHLKMRFEFKDSKMLCKGSNLFFCKELQNSSLVVICKMQS